MAKTTSHSTSRRGRRGGRADVIEFFQPAKQSLWLAVVGFLIRVRAELFVLVVGVAAWLWLRDVTGSGIAAWAVFGGTLVVVLVVPPSRRFVTGRTWCVIDRHRLRTCLRQTKVRTMNMDGALPFLLWARPTKTGEKVCVGIRAGCSSEDLEAALSAIAPACYARDARLSRCRWIATIVVVEIVRRDPLGKPRPIASPLARLTARLTGQPAVAEGSEPIAAATVADIATDPSDGPVIPAQRTNSTSNPKATGSSKSTPASAPQRSTVVQAGEDLSDYID